MIKRNVGFRVCADETVDPKIPQYAGIKGEHNATLVRLLIETEVYKDSDTLRLSFTTGDGSILSSDLIEDYTVADGVLCVEYMLPKLLTIGAGQLCMRAVLSKTEGDEEIVTFRSGEMVLYFDDASVENGTPFWTGVSEMLHRTVTAKDAAVTAQTTAVTAAEKAMGARDSAYEYAVQAREQAVAAARSVSQANGAVDEALSHKDTASRAAISAAAKAVAAQQYAAEAEQAARAAQAAAENSGAGASAYEVAVSNGFDGDEAAWLASLKGDPYTLTDADKAAIVADVITSFGGNPVFGYVDKNNNIIVSGALADGTYSVRYETEDGTTIAIGDLVLDNAVYYTVTNTLTNCINSNGDTQVIDGEGYEATITADSGYTLLSVTVTMGGEDITASAVSGGTITIGNVTGDIVITATAEKAPAEPVTVDITLTDGIRVGSDGTDRTQAGYCATPHIDLSDIPKPCTIHLTGAKWVYDTASETGMIMYYAKKADGTKLVGGYTNDTVGGGYFTVVKNGGNNTDVTVSVTSDEVATIRFSGCWSLVDAGTMAGAGTKATLTYTPD